ncbi:MAG: DNA polymerase III subunit chi [Propionivibrio sp.]|uniref:DNA polymerase III subunit chi n=1 Tax=Candidatus Propionivibrio dominans TaxID=2954373 RepID=A0A9D7FE61_9RHOO|nr:DNA polymerase III subunit chi [Candidatus Propionivibrio dominans]MBL0167715.1 DNA polymerase III subunit chi [Propionivibrio sp.]
MTQIFFYHNAAERIAAAVALIGKACLQKKSLLVYAPDAEVAGLLDRHLWMHPPGGFIPHVRSDSPLAAETPVLIADTLDADDLQSFSHNERLFNLSAEIPPGFARFTSVIEVVGQQDAERLAARERVRFYKDRGYEIKYFDLSEKH